MMTDFNDNTRVRGVNGLTVQAVCKVARDEGQVRETPDALWKELERTEVVLGELSAENEDLVKVRGDARERWRAAAKAVER